VDSSSKAETPAEAVDVAFHHDIPITTSKETLVLTQAFALIPTSTCHSCRQCDDRHWLSCCRYKEYSPIHIRSQQEESVGWPSL